MMHHCRGQGVETDHVGNIALLILLAQKENSNQYESLRPSLNDFNRSVNQRLKCIAMLPNTYRRVGPGQVHTRIEKNSDQGGY